MRRVKLKLYSRLAASTSFFGRGDFESAMPLLLEAEQICRQICEKRILAKTLGHIATVMKSRGDLVKACALYQEEEQLCREVGDDRGLVYSLLDQARILCDTGAVKQGIDLYGQAEALARQCSENDGLFIALFNFAYFSFYKCDDSESALPKCREALNLSATLTTYRSEQVNAENLLEEIKIKLGIP